MNRIILVIIILVLLFLDFAALDDITTGDEGLRLEYATLLISFVFFAAIIFYYIKNRLSKENY